MPRTAKSRSIDGPIEGLYVATFSPDDWDYSPSILPIPGVLRILEGQPLEPNVIGVERPATLVAANGDALRPHAAWARAGRPQALLAEEAKVAQSTVSHAETELKRPTLNGLHNLFATYGHSLYVAIMRPPQPGQEDPLLMFLFNKPGVFARLETALMQTTGESERDFARRTRLPMEFSRHYGEGGPQRLDAIARYAGGFGLHTMVCTLPEADFAPQSAQV